MPFTFSKSKSPSIKITVPKIDPDNFPLWKLSFKLLFPDEKIQQQFLTDKYPRPIFDQTAYDVLRGDTNHPEPDEAAEFRENFETNLTEWIENDNAIMQVYMTAFSENSVAKRIILQVNSATSTNNLTNTARHVWLELDAEFADKTLTTKQSDTADFNNLSAQGYETREDFIRKLQDLALKLAEYGKPVDEVHMRERLLTGLEGNSAYATEAKFFATSNMNVAEITHQCKAWDRKEQAKLSKEKEAANLVSSADSKSQNHISCFECGEIGHKANKCPQRTKSANHGKGGFKGGRGSYSHGRGGGRSGKGRGRGGGKGQSLEQDYR